jgi:uncharacterized protein YuzE
MKTVKELLEEIKASKALYITYGDSDLGIPVLREDTLADIASMDDEQIGEGTWFECDEEGEII